MAELDTFVPPALIPAPNPLTGADELAAAAAVINDPLTEDDIEPTPPFGRTWLFDFEVGQFVVQGGEPVRLEGGLESLRMWMLMALTTRRFATMIHSDEFGIEYEEELVGRTVDALTRTVYIQAVREALLIHDRITEVDDFEFEIEDDGETLSASFTVTTDASEFVRLDAVRLP